MVFSYSASYKDAKGFAEILKETKLTKNRIAKGKFVLSGKKGVKNFINNIHGKDDLLHGYHQYTFQIPVGDLQVELQLYKNINQHFRLFCFTHIDTVYGMTFSINLTTSKENQNEIPLKQQIKFIERYPGKSKVRAQSIRREKQRSFVNLLRRLRYDVNNNNEPMLGVFNPTNNKFIKTSPKGFLNDFLVISILKGHYQGNKGYQLDLSQL